ncbi:MAG: MerR family DNA-binding transcriptional regulator [Acidimicrobiales bacterium]|nr:MerR family DNA-binding transcriptional regulator [Acidimicrobiales bacterium]
MSEAADANRGHLSIGEVLSLLQDEFPDITISKIRFLESQGLIDPERTPSGYRKFYEADIARLRWILVQQRENFLPLKVIKERLERGELDEVSDGAGHVGSPDPPANTELDLPAPTGSGTGGGTNSASGTDAADSDRGRGAARAARDAVRTAPLDPGSASVALSRDELAEAAGISPAEVADLERFGLLSGRTIGPTVLYDESALGVARLAAGFFRHGVEGRHLRMYKVAAEREASFFQQVVMPLLKQRHPSSRQQAVETLGELAELGEGLRAAMLHHALREYLGSP